MNKILSSQAKSRIENVLSSEGLTHKLAQSNIDLAFTKAYLEEIEFAKITKPIGLFPKFPLEINDGIFHPDRPVIPLPGLTRNLNADAFVAALHNDLAAKPISGYTLRLRRDGVTTHTMFWNWARRPQDPIELGWQPTIKMHVASVSKIITAMAVIKLLRDNGLSYDSLVADYLPAYLKVGPNLDGLTFRHLLSHTSGWRQMDDGGINDGNDYSQFKALYGQGVNVADIGQYRYHNGNYIALRVAMNVLTGGRDRNDLSEFPFRDRNDLSGFPFIDVLADALWDASSTAEYVRYVRENVFIPSFAQADLIPAANDSLAYSLDLSKHGAAMTARVNAGTAGWWLSVDEVVNIMNTFWQSNAIVPKTVARRALREGLVCENPWSFQFHRGKPDCFMKGGYWSDNEKRTNQCVAVFAPKNVEIAVFVNSPIPDNYITGMVARRLAENLS